MSTIKSNVFRLAHQIVKRNGITLSEAVKKAWQVVKLQARLQSGKVSFTFKMLNGKICTAYGTLCNINYTPKTTMQKERPIDQIGYWDVFLNGFRSFVAGNLISINN